MRKRLQSKSSLTLTIALGAIALAGCQNTGVSEKPPIQPALEDLPPWNIGDIQQIYKVSAIADSGSGTLREAIELANASPGTDRIVFESDDDLYRKPQTIHLDSALPVITDNLVIDGYIDDMLWKASGVTIDGQDQHRIFNIAQQAKLKVKHLTLTNAKAQRGAGILNEGELVVEGSTFYRNKAGSMGGAIYSIGERAIIYNSTFYQNSAKSSGGAVHLRDGHNRITNSTFAENSGPKGAAIYNESLLTLTNSIVSGNHTAPGCESSVMMISAQRNILESSVNCGVPFSTVPVGFAGLAYYNGPGQTLPPSTRSAVLNWGDNDLARDEHDQPLRWDQRGNGDPRDAMGITDIGAFEIQPRVHFEVDTVAPGEIRGCTPGKKDCSLMGAITLVNASSRHQRITFSDSVCKEELTLSPALDSALHAPLILDASNCQNPLKLVSMSSQTPPQFELINIELIAR